MSRLSALIPVALLLGGVAYLLFEPGSSTDEAERMTGVEQEASAGRRDRPVAAPGLDSESGQALVPEPDPAEEVARDRLTGSARCELTATLVDANGHALAGAQLLVVYENLNPATSTEFFDLHQVLQAGRSVAGWVACATSDARGEVAVSFPRPAQRHVRAFARAMGYQRVEQHLELDQQRQRYELGSWSLEPGTQLGLEVVDPSGQAVVGAQVVIGSHFRENADYMPLHAARTDEQGRAQFVSLNSGKQSIALRAAGFADEHFMLELHAEQRIVERRVELQPEAVLSGRTVDGNEQALADVEVRYQTREPGAKAANAAFRNLREETDFSQSDNQGYFEFRGLKADAQYALEATKEGWLPAHFEAIEPGEDIILKLEKPALARGLVRLTPSQQPLAGARVYALRIGSFLQWRQHEPAETRVEGSFEIPLSPGEYRLLISHPEGEVALDGPYLVDGASDWGEISVPAGGDLELRLHYADAGDPVLRARLFEAAMPGRADRLAELMQCRAGPTMTAPGVYRLSGIQVGEHRFRVDAHNSPPKMFDCHIVAGQTTTIDLTLDRGAEVRVLTLTAEGEAARGTVLGLRRLDPIDPENEATNWSVTCDEGGVAHFEAIVAGQYAIYEGYRSHRQGLQAEEILMRTRIEPGSNQLRLRLPPRAEREFLVLDARGPVEGALVSARLSSNAHVGPVTAHCDAAGRCKLLLANGVWELEASRPGGLARSVEVELPDAPALIEILLTGVEVSGQVVGVRGATQVSLARLEENMFRAHEAGSLQNLGSRPFAAILAPEGRTRVETDTEGRFRFTDVAPGWYRAIGHSSGHYQVDPALFEVQATPVTDIQVQLAEEARLVLEIKGLNADFGQFHMVRVVEEKKGAHIAPLQWVFKNGRVPLPGLPPGQYLVQVCKAPQEGDSLLEPEVVHEIPATVDTLQETLVHWNAGE